MTLDTEIQALVQAELRLVREDYDAQISSLKFEMASLSSGQYVAGAGGRASGAGRVKGIVPDGNGGDASNEECAADTPGSRPTRAAVSIPSSAFKRMMGGGSKVGHATTFEPIGTVHEALLISASDPSSRCHCAGTLLSLAVVLLQCFLLSWTTADSVTPPCLGDVHGEDFQGGQCKAGQFCEWGFQRDGSASVCMDCDEYALFNVTDPATGRTRLEKPRSDDDDVLQISSLRVLGFAGNAPPKYMREAFAPCQGQTPAVCDFIEENYQNFRLPSILVFGLLSLLAIPSLLSEDIDQAAMEQHYFLRRMARFPPGWSRDWLIAVSFVSYNLRVYTLPVMLTIAIITVILTSDLTAINILLNSLAVLFVNGLDDMVAQLVISPEYRFYIQEQLDELAEHSKEQSVDELAELDECAPINLQTERGGDGNVVQISSFIHSWHSRRMFVVLLSLYLFGYVIAGGRGFIMQNETCHGRVVMNAIKDLPILICGVHVVAQSVMDSQRNGGTVRTACQRAVFAFIMSFAFLYGISSFDFVFTRTGSPFGLPKES